MKKLLFNVVSMLILSICVLSCSKKDDDVTPISASEAVGEWTISTVVDEINNPSGLSGDESTKFQKFKDELKRVFQKGDKYSFADNQLCSVTRNNSTADRPTKYEVKDGFLIFDGFIKFKTNLSGDKLTLTAGTEEIRGIAQEELKKEEYGFDADTIVTICKYLSGKLELSLTKQK